MRSTLLTLVLSLTLAASLQAAVVTNTNDSGPGSLRQAILDVNAGSWFINFNVGTGPQVITPATPLPPITRQVSIDARTQPGYSGVPLITIDGSSSGGSGLEFAPGSEQSEAWALAVRGFGIGIHVRAARVIIRRSYIGAVNGGTGNGIGVSFSGSYYEGGGLDQCVVSANLGHGVTIATGILPGALSFPTVGVGLSKIGTDPTGTIGLGNGGHGVLITSGWAAVGQSVVSANARSGVRVQGLPADHFVNVNNSFIGTDASGAADLGNGEAGISIEGTATEFVSALWNVISGNGQDGVRVVDAHLVRLFGNHIGTNAAGTAGIGNAGNGVYATRSSLEIGSVGNVISANEGAGIVTEDGGNLEVKANNVGLNAAGTAAIPNGAHGVRFEAPTMLTFVNNNVGGNVGRGVEISNTANPASSFEGNRVFGNGGDGIVLSGVSNLSVRPQQVATNGGAGIRLVSSSANNVITATEAIQANAGAGITAIGAAAVSNDFRRNVFAANGGLPIDLEEDGATPNDPLDADGGANRRQNFPELLLTPAGLLRISIDTTPSTSVRIELFRIAAATMTFDRELNLVTDSAGHAQVDVTVPVGAWQYVATATTADGTSELSGAALLVLPGDVSIDVSPSSESAGSMVVRLTRTSALGPRTVRINTIAGTATAGVDYMSRDDELVFADGQTELSFTIQLIADSLAEPDESFTIRVSDASTGEEWTAAAVILDDDSIPVPALSPFALIMMTAALSAAAMLLLRR
jgi:hypothetical protein